MIHSTAIRCDAGAGRNISLSVAYRDGLCEETWLEVIEVEECGCVCSSTPCHGQAVRDEDTCTCTCDISNVGRISI